MRDDEKQTDNNDDERLLEENAADDIIASRVNQYAETGSDQVDQEESTDSSCESHEFKYHCSSNSFEHFTKDVTDHIFKLREMVNEEREIHSMKKVAR